MATQQTFTGMPIPKPPTIRSEAVAQAIAESIVREVNLDDFYWSKAELPDRIYDVQQEIIRSGNVSGVFERLHRKSPPINCAGDRSTHPYGWGGIDDHCRAISGRICKQELQKALDAYFDRYFADNKRKKKVSLKIGMVVHDFRDHKRCGMISSFTKDDMVLVLGEEGQRFRIANKFVRRGRGKCKQRA